MKVAALLLLAACGALSDRGPNIYCDAGGMWCIGTDAGPGAICSVDGAQGHIEFNDDGSFYCQENLGGD